MCHFWFNTFFVPDGSLVLPKEEIDKANKDKHDKIFDKTFSIELNFADLDGSPVIHGTVPGSRVTTMPTAPFTIMEEVEGAENGKLASPPTTQDLVSRQGGIFVLPPPPQRTVLQSPQLDSSGNTTILGDELVSPVTTDSASMYSIPQPPLPDIPSFSTFARPTIERGDLSHFKTKFHNSEISLMSEAEDGEDSFENDVGDEEEAEEGQEEDTVPQSDKV